MLLCTFWILLIVSTMIGTVWNSTKTEATPAGRVPWSSACSVGSPRYRGKVREQEGADGFTPKSAPLWHKSGMSHREIEQTHITSTYFPHFLQNKSSCKTEMIEILQQVSVPCLPKDTVALQYHRRRSGMSFLNSGDQPCPSFLNTL